MRDEQPEGHVAFGILNIGKKLDSVGHNAEQWSSPVLQVKNRLSARAINRKALTSQFL